jgi:NAD(P)-dependent dehydrogenase (short-subunit alcohol dehydrogenase family)
VTPQDDVESPSALASFPRGGAAVVIGGAGGVGGAVAARLGASGRFAAVATLSRSGTPALDITDEASVRAAAETVAAGGAPVRLVFVATGFLHGDGFAPEKTWRDLDPAHMARAFAVNAIGPALLMKHFLPLLPRAGKSVFAVLSARVGSIGDNRLGGWYSYRASKAALNQFVRTAAVELARRNPEAICAALHPGTVATRLSAPFAKGGLDVQAPAHAAARLLAVIDGLAPADSGSFLDHRGAPLPW